MDEHKKEKTAKRKTIRKYSLPEKRIKFEKEIEILRGLMEFSKKGETPVNYKDIKGLGSNTYISSELAFLADAGLAEKQKGSKYIPTPEVVKAVNYLKSGKEKDAKEILNSLLRKSWFGDLTIRILNVKREINKRDLMQELCSEAEGDLEKDEKAIEKLLKWLEYAEIIEIDENDMVHLKEVPTYKEETGIPQYEKTESEIKSTESVAAKEIKEGKALTLNLTINIQIDSETDVEKIREIIRIIKQNLMENVEE